MFCFIDDVIVKESGVHEREATHLLSRYLSKATFTDAVGLVLPDEDLPQGYIFNHRRCSLRTLYTPRPGFTMIVSKETTWCSDVKEEETRETVRKFVLLHKSEPSRREHFDFDVLIILRAMGRRSNKKKMIKPQGIGPFNC